MWHTVHCLCCVHWPQDGMNLSALQPHVSACESFFNTHWCPDAAVSTPLQHVTHHTLPLNILHTHMHTHGDNGRGVDRVNPDSPIITILPVSSCSHSEREREREGWGAEDESPTIGLLHPLCVSLCVHLTRVSLYLWSLLEHVKHARRQSIPL